MTKLFFMTGTLGGFFSVALGAFAAHGLKAQLTAQLLVTFKTAVEYQFFHSLALILIALVLTIKPKTQYLNIAGWAMIIGMVLFSGSLYALAITGIKSLGMITPLGGVAFLIGWLAFTLGIWKANV
ncbi:MAG: hypothetical protein COA74_01340 [Gammaproteobacteria bacterium]|nr:MAG: hypothetical protein COA74_01340 [Gammaproteobacteria bacterium]